MKEQTFQIKPNVWKAILADGHVIPAEFNSRGAAEAGIEVEMRRRIKKATKQLTGQET